MRVHIDHLDLSKSISQQVLPDDEVYLVHLRRGQGSGNTRGNGWMNYEAASYYRLVSKETTKCSFSQGAKPAGFLSNYNRFNSVMFGQLDPYYYPALRARHSEAGAQTLWEKVEKDPLPTGVPIAFMDRRKEKEVQQNKSSRSARTGEHQPDILKGIALTASIIGLAGLMRRGILANRRARAARADANAWRRVALRLSDSKWQHKNDAMMKGSQANTASSFEAGSPLEKRGPGLEPTSISNVTPQEPKPRANALKTYVHPHEDWDWIPSDFPRMRTGTHRWNYSRLPPWSIGFSSTHMATKKLDQSTSKRKDPIVDESPSDTEAFNPALANGDERPRSTEVDKVPTDQNLHVEEQVLGDYRLCDIPSKMEESAFIADEIVREVMDDHNRRQKREARNETVQHIKGATADTSSGPEMTEKQFLKDGVTNENFRLKALEAQVWALLSRIDELERSNKIKGAQDHAWNKS